MASSHVALGTLSPTPPQARFDKSSRIENWPASMRAADQLFPDQQDTPPSSLPCFPPLFAIQLQTPLLVSPTDAGVQNASTETTERTSSDRSIALLQRRAAGSASSAAAAVAAPLQITTMCQAPCSACRQYSESATAACSKPGQTSPSHTPSRAGRTAATPTALQQNTATDATFFTITPAASTTTTTTTHHHHHHHHQSTTPLK